MRFLMFDGSCHPGTSIHASSLRLHHALSFPSSSTDGQNFDGAAPAHRPPQKQPTCLSYRFKHIPWQRPGRKKCPKGCCVEGLHVGNVPAHSMRWGKDASRSRPPKPRASHGCAAMHEIFIKMLVLCFLAPKGWWWHKLWVGEGSWKEEGGRSDRPPFNHPNPNVHRRNLVPHWNNSTRRAPWPSRRHSSHAHVTTG